ncbi:MAG: hypothetical protein JKY83_08765 [Rhizobiaceae bacterium]|nr:hypothetical protein [Rhizobiaceae bacterium]
MRNTSKIIIRLFLYTLCIIAAPTSVLAQERWGTPFDAMIEEDQIVVEVKKNNDGTETRKFDLPGKILVQESRKDGKIKGTFLMDQSGLGAVLCTSSLLVSTKIWMDICDDFNNSKSSKRLNTAMDRIGKFIVENSMSPVSLDELNAQIAVKTNKLRLGILEEQKKSGHTSNSTLLLCRGSHEEAIKFVEQMSDGIAGQSEKEFDQSIDDLLSVPRLPVMNPCL